MDCRSATTKDIPQALQLIKVALIGPPNVGKSALFYQLTGKYVNICNYPGTTVDITYKDIPSKSKGVPIRIIDTPGINSVFDTSDDALVSIKVALESDFILFIGDAKNLKKLLNLVYGFKYLNKPFAIILNMWDEAKTVGVDVDIEKLQNRLGCCSLFTTIAIQGWGISKVKEFLSNLEIDYLKNAKENLHTSGKTLPNGYNFLKLLISSGNLSAEDFRKNFNCVVESEIKADKSYFLNFLRESTNDIESIHKESETRGISKVTKYSSTFDRLTTHSFFGVIFVLIILFIAYEFVGVFGAGTLVNVIENKLFGDIINPFIKQTIYGTFGTNFITDGIVGKYGIFTMGFTYAFSIVLPIMFTFFLFFSVLEDLGFFPRLTLLMNKCLMLLGLKGRATLPLVLGFGCDTMATLTTRILPTKRERILTTFILSLAIPCSAQLGVSLGILGSIGYKALFFWIFILIISTIIPVVLANKLIFAKSTQLPFIMEIPPFRRPYISNIFYKTFLKIGWYLKEAVPLFILGTFVLYVSDSIGLLNKIQLIGGPVVNQILGLPPQMIAVFVLGFLRRDYGAAGLYALFQEGTISPFQTLVSVVMITLFVPCFAQFMITVKEFGYKIAAAFLFFNFFYAISVGAILIRLNNYLPLLK